MNTLFDLEAIPMVTPKDKPKKPQYYLRMQLSTGLWYFLWRTHSNGGPEWAMETGKVHNRKTPLRYKTLSGATKALATYVPVVAINSGVAVWNEQTKS